MNVTVSPGRLSGSVAIPGSKSHTIRALLFASMARGESRIESALDSQDTRSCVSILRRLGVEINEEHTDHGLSLAVRSSGEFRAPSAPLDCGNSGTTLYLALALAALHRFQATFTGDESLRQRSAGPLLDAIEQLGARVDREGDCVPFTIEGPITGGAIMLESPVSQFLSGLLLAAPFTPEGVEIDVPLLNERPYVGITLGWLDRLGIAYTREEWRRFVVRGGQEIAPFQTRVPADFSSATFFAVAAAMTHSSVTLQGLDLTDSQGDKEVLSVLESLGAEVDRPGDPGADLTVSGASGGVDLAGGSVDLNSMPDALPSLAILGTICSDPLELVNVPQARAKETDRITAMTSIINGLGGVARELPDGMVIEPRRLQGGVADSLADHRIAMALAIGGLISKEPVRITNAEVASVTFPGFYKRLAECGAQVEIGE